MITIICKEKSKFYYKGKINIKFTDKFLEINAISHDINENNSLYLWDRQVYDVFYLDNIKSIIGDDN